MKITRQVWSLSHGYRKEEVHTDPSDQVALLLELQNGTKIKIGETVGGDLRIHTLECGILVGPVSNNVVIISRREFEEVEHIDERA